jgi:hypothetical protein
MIVKRRSTLRAVDGPVVLRVGSRIRSARGSSATAAATGDSSTLVGSSGAQET